MMSGRSSSGSSRYPFTPSQWQELEHQALIYKYMASGTPIPSDLILPIRRNYLLDSTFAAPSIAFPPQHSLGWGCYQMGYGRKAEDPEPGRCRRTDGKKWRCSKEAYPDSKYCEKHMHRGKNRSRKPVEMSLATATAATTATSSSSPVSYSSTSTAAAANPGSINRTTAAPVTSSISMSIPLETNTNHLFPYSSSMTRSPYNASPFHSHTTNNSFPFHLENHSTSSYLYGDKDYRYCHGMNGMDEQPFLSDAAGSGRESSWQFTSLGTSSFGCPKQQGSSNGYNNRPFTLDLARDHGGGVQAGEKEQRCFLLGADLKLDKTVKGYCNGGGDAGDQKPLRRFIDEWPQKSKQQHQWMDVDGGHGYSNTQLSISLPMDTTPHEYSIDGVGGFRHDG